MDNMLLPARWNWQRFDLVLGIIAVPDQMNLLLSPGILLPPASRYGLCIGNDCVGMTEEQPLHPLL
jgi:hypothetical protein